MPGTKGTGLHAATITGPLQRVARSPCPRPPTRWAVTVMIACASLAAQRTAAAAETALPLSLVAPETLPFSADEIDQAVAARAPAPADRRPGEEISPVVVGPADAAGVAVRAGGSGVRVVPVGDRRGSDAARVVALVIADLLSSDVAPPAAVVAIVVRPPAPPPVPPPPAAGTVRQRRVTAAAGLSRGMGAEELASYVVDADLALPLGRRWPAWRLVPSLGVAWLPRRNPAHFNDLSFTAAVARLGLGTDVGPIQLVAGPFLSPYAIGGAAAHDGVLLGADLLARVAPALWRRLRLVVAVRADAYANRVRVIWGNGAGYATPRIAGSVAAGLAWDVAP